MKWNSCLIAVSAGTRKRDATSLYSLSGLHPNGTSLPTSMRSCSSHSSMSAGRAVQWFHTHGMMYETTVTRNETARTSRNLRCGLTCTFL